MKVVLSRERQKRFSTTETRPPIQFVESTKQKSTDDNDNTAKFTCYTDPTDSTSPKFVVSVSYIYNYPDAEGWTKHMSKLIDLYDNMAITDDSYDEETGEPTELNASKRYYVTKATLAGSLRTLFNSITEKRTEENLAKPENEQLDFRYLFKLIMNDVAKKMFPRPETAYSRQTKYMSQGLFLGKSTVDDFYRRFQEINNRLVYFPKYENRTAERLSDFTIVKCLENVIRPEWRTLAAKDEDFWLQVDTKTPEEIIEKYNTYERTCEVEQEVANEETTADRRSKRKRKRGASDENSTVEKRGKRSQAGIECEHCGKPGHKSKDCWTLERNASKRPNGYKSRRNNGDRNRKHGSGGGERPSKAQIFAVTKYLEADAKKKSTAKAKAKRIHDDDSAEDAYITSELNPRVKKMTTRDGSDDSSIETESDVSSVEYSSDDGKSNKRRRTSKQFVHMITNSMDPHACLSQIELAERDLSAHDATSDTISSKSCNATCISSLNVSKRIKRPAIPADSEYANPFFNRGESPKKKSKRTHYSAEIVVEIEDRHGNLVPIRALLDTGTSSSIILREFVRKGRANTHKGKRTTWSTLGGNFSTNRKALIDFKIPELSTHKTVTWITHVDDKSSSAHAQFDCILGMDVMCELGIYINTEDKTVCWEGATIPLKERGTLQDYEVTELIYHMAVEPKVLKDERQSRILDADYSKVDIGTHIDELKYLSDSERASLKATLSRHEKLFSGGLGTLNVRPISLELIDDAVPYHAKPFPIPQSICKIAPAETSTDALRIPLITSLKVSPYASNLSGRTSIAISLILFPLIFTLEMPSIMLKSSRTFLAAWRSTEWETSP